MADVAPVLDFGRDNKVSGRKLYEIFADGQVDTIIIGARRYILLSSWAAYIHRLQQGIERDPIEREHAIAAYRASADASVQRLRGGTGSRLSAPERVKGYEKPGVSGEIRRRVSPPHTSRE